MTKRTIKTGRKKGSISRKSARRAVKAVRANKYKEKSINISFEPISNKGSGILMYVGFSKNKVKSTVRVADGIYIDYDSKQKVIGVEIL